MKRISEKSVKNKLKNKLKIIIVCLILVVCVSFALIKFLPTIKNIDVKVEVLNGKKENIKITKEQIVASSNLKVGEKLYKYLRSEIVKNVEENPYVKTAEIHRYINGKVELDVVQRNPSYLINYAGDYLYLDNEGYVLEVNSQNNGSPVLIGLITDFSGLTVVSSKIRLEEKDLEKLEIVNQIMLTLKSNDVKNEITSIDVTEKNDIVLNLEKDNKTVHLGDGTELNTKILYMKKILEKEAENNGVIYINGKLGEGYVYFKEQ